MDIVDDQTDREREYEEHLNASIVEAKQQIYDKVKQQFDQGNVQFQKVRQQLKVSPRQSLHAIDLEILG